MSGNGVSLCCTQGMKPGTSSEWQAWLVIGGPSWWSVS